MRGIHTGEWTAHIFEYAMSFEGNMTQVRELAAANGVGVLHPHGALATDPPGLVVCDVDSTVTRTEPSICSPSAPGKPMRSAGSPPAPWPENWTSHNPCMPESGVWKGCISGPSRRRGKPPSSPLGRLSWWPLHMKLGLPSDWYLAGSRPWSIRWPNRSGLISQPLMSSKSSMITSPDEWLVTSSTGRQRRPGYVAGPRNAGSLLSEQSP
ncbi:phosphoserine phosphatase [Cutibacterium acnes JCM 18920]|nr:phosphoserine phosphatase [Cutibacterium acnes JCM 18920]